MLAAISSLLHKLVYSAAKEMITLLIINVQHLIIRYSSSATSCLYISKKAIEKYEYFSINSISISILENTKIQIHF